MGVLDSYWAASITTQINELGHVQGACERIATTPLPLPYTLLVHRTAYLYILLAPFAMAQQLGWWTIVFNALLAYTFFGLDELARLLEVRSVPLCSMRFAHVQVRIVVS
jgi:putative membrane protein